MFTRKLIIIALSTLMVVLGTSLSAYGQSDNTLGPIPVPFSEASLQSEMARVQDDATITAEDKAPIIELYSSALARLIAGRESAAQVTDFFRRQENAPQTVEKLERDTIAVHKNSRRTRDDVMSDYAEQTVTELEQNLAKEQANADTLRGLMSQYDKYRQSLEQRPALALKEIAALEQAIANTAPIPETPGNRALGNLERAGTALTRAKLYADQQKKRALEQEISSTTARSKVLSKQVSLTRAQIEQSNVLISVLKERTGSARTDDAKLRLADAQKEQQEFLNDHPLVQSYAAENVALAQRNLDIAKSEENLPDEEIEIGIKLLQVRFDANVTDQILSSQRVNKAYGAHLRSLRKKQPDISQIQQRIKARETDLQDALFQRITTQEDIGIFNANPLDIAGLKRVYNLHNRGQNSDLDDVSPELSEKDIEHLQRAYDSRRGHLNELASVASLRARKLEEVNSLHQQFLDEVKALCVLLDSRLLWLPSTETIGLSWPGKITQGIGQTFAPSNLSSVGRAFIAGIKNSYFLVFLALGFLAALHTLRQRIKPAITSMSFHVGRVQKDGFGLTPLALFDGAIHGLTIAGLAVTLALVFSFSGSDNSTVQALTYTSLVLAAPLFVLSALRSWSTKGALFDIHFRVDRELRDRLLRNIPWLIVVIGASVFLVGLTGGSLDFDSGAAALGVFGFIIGALAISWFSLKISWARTRVFMAKNREAEGMYLRNERWFLILGIIVPFGTALLAAFGYFETAQLLLSRFFFSFCILMAAYLLHGLLKRTLVIAQRRLALEHARTRRDRLVKERMDKAAAEERGEIAVPKLDTESIDLEPSTASQNS